VGGGENEEISVILTRLAMGSDFTLLHRWYPAAIPIAEWRTRSVAASNFPESAVESENFLHFSRAFKFSLRDHFALTSHICWVPVCPNCLLAVDSFIVKSFIELSNMLNSISAPQSTRSEKQRRITKLGLPVNPKSFDTPNPSQEAFRTLCIHHFWLASSLRPWPSSSST